MALRLTVVPEGATTAIHVDGRLTARELGELDKAVRSVATPVVLVLSNLLSADDAGIAALRSLAGEGMQLIGATPYVALLLEVDAGTGGSPAKPRGRPRR